MVSYNIIEDIIDKSIFLVKCDDYPKAIELRNFNPQDYQIERYDEDDDVDNVHDSPVGELESIQQELQFDMEYSTVEDNIVHGYGQFSFAYVNRFLQGRLDWDVYNYYTKMGTLNPNLHIKRTVGFDEDNHPVQLTINQYINSLSEIIKKTPPLQQDTVLYCGCRWEKGLVPGQSGRIKSFRSTSFNEKVARFFRNLRNEDGGKYLVKIYAPKGTLGLDMDDRWASTFQSEWLLDKGQRYVVLSQDDNKKEVEILLY